jgi:signal transduction histidine kinase
MTQNKNQELIDDLIKLSKNTDDELQLRLRTLIDVYQTQERENEKLKKENNFFLKKWDKRNLIDTKKDKIIEQQSRMAAMGEMIDAVAHQWKQPLNAISMIIDMLKIDFRDSNDVDYAYIQELDSTVHLQIDHMVTTLNEFRNFLRPSTKNETFYIQTAIDNVRILMKDELIAQNVHLNLNIDETIKIFGNRNEIKHLFINIINNAIDVFNERDIQHRGITINCYSEYKKIYIEIEDNAGGVPEEIIADIFKPNVTSKANGKGTGIGLYMSTQIVEKNNGSINVHNSEVGAFFTIILHPPTV